MTWKNFVMFHKQLEEKSYTIDPSFSFDHYTFIEANPDVPRNIDTDFFDGHIIKEWELPEYNERLQAATYMAPSIIYHIYKNNLHTNLSHIGFLEYDIPLKRSDLKSVSETISDIINKNERVIIPYRYQHTLSVLRNQKNIKMNGRNAVDQIFDDYNDYFNTTHKPKQYLDQKVTTQQSFLADIKTFEKIMGFISHVIDNKLAERKNSWHRPSTLMDRYFAVSLLLENDAKTIPLSLEHQNLKQWSETLGHKNMTIPKNFEKKGWDIIRNVLTSEECEQAIRRLKVDSNQLSKDVGTEKSSRRMGVMYKTLFFKNILKKIKENQTISALLSDFEEPIVEHMKPLIKAPQGGVETPWHQDGSFWSDFDPEETMFTIWIALTKTTKETGAMQVLDKVDHGDQIEHVHTHNGNERVIKEDVLEKFLLEGEAVPCELNPGDALIFKSNVIHSAFHNVGDESRIAFKVVFQDAKKRPIPVSKFGFHLEGFLGKMNLNTPVNLFWSR
ncbi:MAG: phytanoyl-CoA dioxygenase family protein [Bdellovibrionales bacterium]